MCGIVAYLNRNGVSKEQIDEIQNTEKGSSIIQVKVTDEEGKEPIICQMEWAWAASKRKGKRRKGRVSVEKEG